MDRTVTLRHGRIDLALHRLRDGKGRALLLLHGLGERTPHDPSPTVAGWPGPVWGLDFCGHGDSTVPVGGGYTAEILTADASMALDHLGAATVVGRGLGAWIALQLAGAYPEQVLGVVLADGPGLIGGGIRPGSAFVIGPAVDEGAGTAPDPFALVELARDVRPPDYATVFVRFVLERCPMAEPVVVAAVARPEWLEAVVQEPGVVVAGVTEALEGFAVGPEAG